MSVTQQAGGMFEYRLDAPDLTTLATALIYIQASGLVGSGLGPDTMVGPETFEDATNTINPHFELFKYGVGVTATTYTGPDGVEYTSAAKGVAGRVYIAIRTTLDIAALGLDPTALGLTWSYQQDSIAVLGRWF